MKSLVYDLSDEQAINFATTFNQLEKSYDSNMRDLYYSKKDFERLNAKKLEDEKTLSETLSKITKISEKKS